jgi:hypothetical protein
MARTFRINSPSVVAEIIDDEAIVLNLATGHYFSARGSGCDLWHAIGAGHDAAGAAATLASRYGMTVPEIAPLVDDFISDLVVHGLVIEVNGDGSSTASTEPRFPAGAVAAFTPPLLEVYTDMEELLLLDPIHDVDAASGWPVPKSDATR